MSTLKMQMFPCPHCPAQFDTFKSLEHHLRAMHTETLHSFPYRCVTCDTEFMEQAEWLDHVREEHSEDLSEDPETLD